MSDWKPKRFWKQVRVAATDGGYSVLLDERPVRTPAKASLVVPTEGFAKAIADEWQAQEKEVDPRVMPFTRTANAAIDKVAVQHAEVADMLADYGDSDLLCYRAEGPEELVARQVAAWNPMLEWAAEHLGAGLQAHVGVMHQPQEAAAIAHMRRQVHALDSYRLAAFHDLVSLSGSLVLGFAVARGAFAPDAVWDVSRIDEEWQAEQWGRDDDADAMTAVKRASFLHAATIFRLCAQE